MRILASAFVPLLAVAAIARFDIATALLVSVALIAFLICSATDLLCYRVPDVITLPGCVLTLVAAATLPGGSLQDALLGIVLGAAIFLPASFFSGGRLGLADAKLAILICAVLGLGRGYDALVLGVALGGISLLLLLIVGAIQRRQVTPYSPFLAMSAIAVALIRGTAFAPL